MAVKVLSLTELDVDKQWAERRAMAMLAAMEGAQLVARSRGGDVSGFDQTIDGSRMVGLFPQDVSSAQR